MEEGEKNKKGGITSGKGIGRKERKEKKKIIVREKEE